MMNTYSRVFLLSLRFWWKPLQQRVAFSTCPIAPLAETTWMNIKCRGLLKSTRGKRTGLHRHNFQSYANISKCSSSLGTRQWPNSDKKLYIHNGTFSSTTVVPSHRIPCIIANALLNTLLIPILVYWYIATSGNVNITYIPRDNLTVHTSKFGPTHWSYQSSKFGLPQTQPKTFAIEKVPKIW